MVAEGVAQGIGASGRQTVLAVFVGSGMAFAVGMGLPEVDEDDEEPVLFESEQIWFSKNPDGHYVIASLDGSIALRFASLVVAEDGPDEDSTLFPLVAVEDANGNHQRFVYHPLTGLPQYVIDGNGRVFSLNFGNVADEQSPKMRLLSVSLLEGLPAFGEAVRVGSPLVRYEYNSSGDLVRVIGRDGNVKRSFGYKNNLMVSHTDAAGLVSEYEYDHYTPTGKVLRNWTSLGEEWRFTYHDGYTEVTDVLGRTEQYHYDYNNELTKRVFADGSAVLMERDGLGRLLSHTDAMGRVTRYQYSNEGQVEAIVRPDGAILHFDYDDCYRLIRKSDAEGRYDGYTYDEAGNLLTHTDPLKHTTRFEYADNGLLLSVTDPNGSSTAYHYNENRQPDLITDCSGYETKLAYTPEGQLARITDALGQHTKYHYDANQNLTLALYPDGSKETFGYDAAGRLKREQTALIVDIGQSGRIADNALAARYAPTLAEPAGTVLVEIIAAVPDQRQDAFKSKVGFTLQKLQPVYRIHRAAGSGGGFAGNTGFGRQFLIELVVHVEHIAGTDDIAFADFNRRRMHPRLGRFGGGARQHPLAAGQGGFVAGGAVGFTGLEDEGGLAVEAYVIGDGLGTAQVGEEREGDGRCDRRSGRRCPAEIGEGKDDIEVTAFTGDFIECHGGLLLSGGV